MAHRKTCTCEPQTGWDLTVYPPNAILYGTCDTCGQIRWGTERFNLRTREHTHATHCDCCTHPHNLQPGGHHISGRRIPK